jgi:hypothetical protein
MTPSIMAEHGFNAEYRIQALYAECHYAECRYAECRGGSIKSSFFSDFCCQTWVRVNQRTHLTPTYFLLLRPPTRLVVPC